MRTRPTALRELVCSNSFRSDDATSNAVGVIHAEMRMAGSLIMACCRQASGSSRRGARRRSRGLSDAVTKVINDHPLVSVVREEVTGLPPKEWDLGHRSPPDR